MTRKLFLYALCGAALLLAGCRDAALDAGSGQPVTAILGARLIDGTGAAPVEDAVIVIEGGKIRAAGPRAGVPVPKESQRIDGTGKTIVPGFVDAHNHYHGDRAEVERKLRTHLAWGVTTARSIGTDKADNLALFAEVRAGKVPGPRIYTAGLGFTHPEGHPVAIDFIRRPATPAEARAGVQEAATQQVDFVKMWVESLRGAAPKIAPEVRAAIVDEAGKHGIRAVAHITEEADLRQLADLGVRDFLHQVRDKPATPELIAYSKSKGLVFTPTLAIIESAWHFAENSGELEDQAIRAAFDPTVLAPLEDPAERRKMLAGPGPARGKADLQSAQTFLKTMWEAGVPAVCGSDSGAGNVPIGWGTHREMELFVQAGLSPMNALRAATAEAARLLAGGEPDYGILAAGKAADLVMLEADPLADIRNTRKIARVMQAGQWVDGR